MYFFLSDTATAALVFDIFPQKSWIFIYLIFNANWLFVFRMCNI